MIEVSDIIKDAIYIREFEEKLLELFSEGKLNGTVHTCVGQELIPVVLERHLKDKDTVFSNHRGHGHYLARGGCSKLLMKEILGRNDGIAKGIGGSQHLKTKNFYSNGIQGGMAPIAVGYSFKKEDEISVCYIGDGTLGEGQLYEAFILSKILKSPTLFVLENNGYAQSTKTSQIISGDLKSRIEGFGLDYFQTNVWSLHDLDETFKSAVSNVRKGKPTVIEVECYRLNSHSKGDDNRIETEVESYRNADIINQFLKSNHIEGNKLVSSIRNELQSLLNEIQHEPEHGAIDINEETVNYKNVKYKKVDIEKARDRINQKINNGLKTLVSNGAILLGEDICDSTSETPHIYGGAFKVTKGLSTEFPESVINTSISEAGIVGVGVGIALSGRQAISEIMFGDFLTLAFDQLLQQVSKITYMYGEKILLPLLVRTPMGGRRGYGPTHSQNIEKHFLFIPGVNVIALNCFSEPEEILLKIEEKREMYLMIEDKVSYTKPLSSIPIAGYELFQSEESFPTYVLKPTRQKPQVAIICYGAMLGELTEVLKDLVIDEFVPLIISPTQIAPLNLAPIKQVISGVNDVIFIEEGSKRGAFSSEVISSLLENGVHLNVLGRISNERIIPCDKRREAEYIPSRDNLIKKIQEVIS